MSTWFPGIPCQARMHRPPETSGSSIGIKVDLGKTAACRLLCCLLLALPGCDSAPETPLTTQSDSAGIPITTALAPRWGPGEGWKVSGDPLLEIGATTGAAEYLLNGVVGAVRLSNGDIVLGEWSSGELRRYDGSGTFMWRAAGRGEGPGEHLFMQFVGSVAGDSLVTYDGGRARAQVFAPGGDVARTMPIESPWSGFAPHKVIGLSGRQMIVTFGDNRGELPNGAVRFPGIRIATFSLEDGAVAEVMDVPGAEQHIVSGGGRIVYSGYQFGKGPRLAVTPGRLAVVDTEAFSIRSISLEDGTTTAILRRDVPIQEVTSNHVEAYVDWMAEQNMTSGGSSLEQAEASKPGWRDGPMASTLPVLESIHLDAAENLWVEPYALPGARAAPFEVFAPNGTWLGTVATPPGLALGTDRVPVGFEIGEDYVLGLWRDELGVEYVRMYGLER